MSLIFPLHWHSVPFGTRQKVSPACCFLLLKRLFNQFCQLLLYLYPPFHFSSLAVFSTLSCRFVNNPPNPALLELACGERAQSGLYGETRAGWLNGDATLAHLALTLPQLCLSSS